MSKTKRRVYWKADELDRVARAFAARLMRGEYSKDALDHAQRETLPPERWRSLNSNAVAQVRAHVAKLPPAAPVPEITEAAPPDPVPPPPAPPSLRETLTQLIVDAGRILLADETFQEIALSVGRRFLVESLQTPTPAALAPQPTSASVPEVKRQQKPLVLVVGLLNGQQSMLEREYGEHLDIRFVAQGKWAALRDVTRNAEAAYVMKFAGHAEWNKVQELAGENVSVGFMTGIDKLRRALDAHRAAAGAK